MDGLERSGLRGETAAEEETHALQHRSMNQPTNTPPQGGRDSLLVETELLIEQVMKQGEEERETDRQDRGGLSKHDMRSERF